MSSGLARILGPAVAIAVAIAAISGPVSARTLSDDPVGLTEARTDHTATLLADESVLLAGGSDGDTELASVEIIDPVGMSVALLGSLATSRADHTATLLPDGRILVAGGRAANTSLADAELLDPETGVSDPAGSMKWARADHQALTLPDGRVLLIGGVADGKPVARAEIFDPAKGTFKAAAKTKATHLDPAATVLPFGNVLLTGTPANKKGKPAEIYDATKDKWSTLKKSPKTSGHTATPLRDGRILLVGGSSVKTQLFDLAKGKFAAGDALNASRTGHTATPLLFGEVLILGGQDGGREVPEIELFSLETDTIDVIGEMYIPRVGHTTTALPDGGALVAGGSFAGLALDDLLYLDPDNYTLAPLGGDRVVGPAVTETRTKADIRAELGPPGSFVTLYPDRTEPALAEPASIETWTYYDTGTELTFEGEMLVGEEAIEPQDDALSTPYDPALFEAYMSLEEVLAAAGVEDYFGGPMDEAETTELYYAQQLAWGLKGDALYFIEGIALGDEVTTEEAP